MRAVVGAFETRERSRLPPRFLQNPAPRIAASGALGYDTATLLRAITERLREDLRAALAQDPAARGLVEVLLAYPGLHAIWVHRVAHRFWQRGFRLTPRLLSHLGRFLTGVEIHPGAQLGRRVFIDHGMGVVIGETAEVGDDCLIYKGVVLGGVSQARVRRHPRLGKGVVIGSNACVLGAIEIGDGARVGSGSVVIRDVPAGATVVGIPGRLVTGPHVRADPAHADLPDPVADALARLAFRVEQLERQPSAASGGSRKAKPGVAQREAELADPFAGAVEGRRDWPPANNQVEASGAAGPKGRVHKRKRRGD